MTLEKALADIKVLKRELADLRKLVLAQEARIEALEDATPAKIAARNAEELVNAGLLEKRV